MDAPRPMDASRPATMTAALVAVAALAGLDAGVVLGIATPARLAEPTPLDDAATLVARLSALRRHDGPTVALLGDSVVYGRALVEHGAGDWRSDNLAPALSAALGPDWLGVNLAMDGSLPADQARLLPLVLDAEPDLVVLDVSLRSFSADFRPETDRATRAWLAELRPGPTLAERLDGQPPWERAERVARAAASRAWGLYRYRTWLQVRFLGGEPRAAVERGRDAVLRGGAPAGGEPDDAELALMLRTKARYATVDLAGHPQADALREAMAALHEANQPAVLFYATENPALLPSLVDPADHAADLAALEALVAEGTGPRLRWLPPEEAPDPATFLDHVHRTPDGLAALAARIAAAAPAAPRDTAPGADGAD